MRSCFVRAAWFTPMFLTLTIGSKVQPREYFKGLLNTFHVALTVWPARKCTYTVILKVDRVPQAS